MRKAIYGGSFNPIHLDHIALCRQIKNEFSLDRVILIPTSKTPLKDNSYLVSDEHRLNMCRLAAADDDFIEVSDIEIQRKGLSYTSDTIAQLKTDEDELFLIVGADMFMTLEKWHDFRYIFENVTVLTIPRGEYDINVLQKKYNELKPFGCQAQFSLSPVGSLSSTVIREKLKRGEDLSDSLHPDVIKYIKKNQLYCQETMNNKDVYLQEVNKLSDYRRIHSLNVSKEAVRLAKKYGADVEKAEIAGLLHDITKEMDNETQLKIIENGGIMLSAVEKASPQLYHAMSASVYVKTRFGIDDEDILSAIRYHTTARANMSLLEKVIFLADFTSADRKFDDIDVIREKANISLEDGMLYALQFTISRISKRGGLISPDALNAYNEIVLKKSEE